MNNLVTVEQAFDVAGFHAKYNEVKPRSYQAIMIEAPRDTNPKNPKVKPQKCINITFAPLGDEKNKYRGTGNKGRVFTAFETTHNILFLLAKELFEIADKLPVDKVAERTNVFRQLIRDEVKFFEYESILPYNPTDRDGNILENLRTGGNAVTKNHTFFLLADDSPSRALAAETYRIENWIQGDHVDASFDPETKTSAADEEEVKKAADELAKLEAEAKK